MKKNSKNTRKKARGEAKQHEEAMKHAALAEREASTLVVGIDLGDRVSTYCVRGLDQQMVAEGTVKSKPEAVVECFQGLKRQRMVLETGTHSRWMAQLLELMGHEVIVGNARKLKLISENNQKSDKVDPRLLSMLGVTNTAWLHPVYVRSEATQQDLTVVRARQMLVEARTGLINGVRGTVKSCGCRVGACDTGQFAERAVADVPEGKRGALSGVLATIAAMDEEIYRYDREIEHLCRERYEQQTKRLMQVSGVGAVTALTYVLTIEDAERFKQSRDVGAYLGLVPKKKQSGKKDPQLGISKTGDELLRKLLVNCAQHIIGPLGRDSDLRRWGLRLVEASERAGRKHGAKKRAAVAVARKLSVLLHRLWVTGEAYEPLHNSGAKPAAALG